MEWIKQERNWKLIEDRRNDFENVEELMGFVFAKCLKRNKYWFQSVTFE